MKNEKEFMDQAKLIKRLEKPAGKSDVVLDTDTYNEFVDQFALAYLIRSDEKLNLKAVYAAPSTMTNPQDLQTVWKKATMRS